MRLKPLHTLALGALGAAIIAVPIVAQQQSGRDRPSRECMREIAQLCGRDRSKIRACIQENQDKISDKCFADLRERAAERRGQNARNQTVDYGYVPPPARTIIYGQDRRQQIDVYEPDGAVDELPLVLHIHGGGWSAGNHKRIQAKPRHFTGKDYYFASTGYRLLPDVPVEEQARDVGLAVQALRGQARSIGFDPDRIAIMGHSAGAHLAALVATDPQFAGDAFTAIKGVILLDGAAYEIPSTVASSGPKARALYTKVFSDNAARQTELSPISYVGAPDAPNWLALYVEGQERQMAQSDLLADRLTSAGAKARAVAIPETDHLRMNREIGIDAGAAQTKAIDAFLAEIFR